MHAYSFLASAPPLSILIFATVLMGTIMFLWGTSLGWRIRGVPEPPIELKRGHSARLETEYLFCPNGCLGRTCGELWYVTLDMRAHVLIPPERSEGDVDRLGERLGVPSSARWQIERFLS